MNVAIIGSCEVGKTTFYEKVMKELPDAFTYFYESTEDKKPETDTFFGYMHTQEKILKEQLRQLQWAKTHRMNILTDGSIIDTLACMIKGKESPYVCALSDDAKNSRDILEVISPIVQEAILHFYDYDLLFYIPVEFKRENLSKEEILYQWTIDNIIKHLLEVYGIRHHVVGGSVEDRKLFIKGMITEFELHNR